MFEVQHIASFDLPGLAAYRTMKFQGEHRKEGIFVAESEKVVRRLLESELGVVSMVLPEGLVKEFEEALNRRKELVRVYCAPKAVLEELTGFQMYQGVMAVGRVPAQPTLQGILNKTAFAKSERTASSPWPSPPEGEREKTTTWRAGSSDGAQLDGGAQLARPLLLVAADGIANAHNVGVLVRNCAGFSADALLVAENSCSPFLRRAVGASVGTIFKLPAVELTNLCETLKVLKERGIWCVAAHPHTDQRTLMDADFRRDVCVVFGAEGEGIRREVLALCDEAVAIPMPKDVDSLNVGSASAVFLYEVARQRKEG